MKSWGFTLIELLIVVAIIAILAAIAIPNFLNAQVRSKVSRMESDMRTLGVAIELYHVDYGKYPRQGPEGTCVVVTTGLPELTTPIAHITSIPIDIFHDEQGLPWPIQYSVCRSDLFYWELWSFGPDRVDQYGTLLYDPTNGTVSAGDIKRTTAHDLLLIAP